MRSHGEHVRVLFHRRQVFSGTEKSQEPGVINLADLKGIGNVRELLRERTERFEGIPECTPLPYGKVSAKSPPRLMNTAYVAPGGAASSSAAHSVQPSSTSFPTTTSGSTGSWNVVPYAGGQVMAHGVPQPQPSGSGALVWGSGGCSGHQPGSASQSSGGPQAQTYNQQNVYEDNRDVNMQVDSVHNVYEGDRTLVQNTLIQVESAHTVGLVAQLAEAHVQQAQGAAQHEIGAAVTLAEVAVGRYRDENQELTAAARQYLTNLESEARVHLEMASQRMEAEQQRAEIEAQRAAAVTGELAEREERFNELLSLGLAVEQEKKTRHSMLRSKRLLSRQLPRTGCWQLNRNGTLRIASQQRRLLNEQLPWKGCKR